MGAVDDDDVHCGPVQAAYLRFAAQTLLRHGTATPALAAASERRPNEWPPRLLKQTLADIYRFKAEAERCGVDFSRVPLPPNRRHEHNWPTCSTPSSQQDASLMVPDTVQLRTAAQILSAPAGVAPINFDHSIDSLRGVPVSELAGQVQDRVIERLEGGNVGDIFELLMRIPRTYIDRSALTPLAAVQPGRNVTFAAKVLGVMTNREKRYVRIRVGDQHHRVSLTFFNALWMAKRFNDRDLVVVQGDVGEWNGVPTMSSPIIERVDEASSILIPIYPQSTIKDITTGKRDKDLSTTMLRQAATAALQRIPSLNDPIPRELVVRRRLMSRLDAIRAVHVPDSPTHASAGRARMAYDELLRLQLALGVIRNSQAATPGVTHKPTGALLDRWLSGLPYMPTGAQTRAIAAIRSNLSEPKPMNRLLLGDVGSGKSLVIGAAGLMAIEGGYQAALLAPTEILARQHFDELEEALTPLGVQVDLLVSKQLPRPRKSVLADIAGGIADLVIGTHSLLSEAVTFSRLGLIMVDEQHRFGVDQRAALLAKGPNGTAPDILQATATPIPRTAAITTYGDMDVTILDEKPAGRVDVKTRWIRDADLDDPTTPPWQQIRNQVAEGRQAFVVCSRVNSDGKQSETKSAAAAEETAEALASGVLAGLTVAVAHGKQKPDERKAIMAAFKAGVTSVLVATTVIEVGVSVPNATVMVVLDAQKFGLAQLHQIRGRVGRGQDPGHCWLVCEAEGGDAGARMTAMVSTNNGFQLSEMDLQIRGVGSLTGTEQSGHDAGLRVADLLKDANIHLAARADAHEILATDPQLLRHLTLKREVDLALGADADYLTRG